MKSMSTSINFQDHEIKAIQYSIAIVSIVLCSFAIFLTLIFFAFNVKYRNFRLIKMSSPNINNIINVNCIILYLCPIFNSIKGLNLSNEILSDTMCQVNSLILPICSTAIYAAMLTKAWRIYKIFETTPKMKRVVIKDIRLVVYIGCMIMIDAVIVLVWYFVDTIKLKPRYVYETLSQPAQIVVPASYSSKFSFIQNTKTANLSSYIDSNLPIIHNSSHISSLKVVFECDSNYNEVWITILTMYKIILLMYGIYLAWIIRNINVPSMNDSKYLLLSTYTIIVCGLGSMTLMQLLRDWPDVVQAFFTIGVVLATCTTQCLVFIPKIRLWYKRRNDDNFKISLSQVFLQSSSSCYYSDKSNKNATNNANMINLEEELCELLHENGQLKNFLKEKEEVIKVLQDKIRMTKATLIQVNEQQKKLLENEYGNHEYLFDLRKSNTTGDLIKEIKQQQQQQHYPSLSSSCMQPQSQSVYPISNSKGPDGFADFDTSSCTATTTTDLLKGANNTTSKSNIFQNSHLITDKFPIANTEQLKNELDEVEEITSRVRDSISIDLSNTRRYSPLLYEYYRKQLELAKSIQCTYNIQCNTLFDAMTLMRKCLRDYCQTVHNPEYLAIETLNTSNNEKTTDENSQSIGLFSYNDFIKKHPFHAQFAKMQQQNQQYNTHFHHQQSNSLPTQSFSQLHNINEESTSNPYEDNESTTNTNHNNSTNNSSQIFNRLFQLSSVNSANNSKINSNKANNIKKMFFNSNNNNNNINTGLFSNQTNQKNLNNNTANNGGNINNRSCESNAASSLASSSSLSTTQSINNQSSMMGVAGLSTANCNNLNSTTTTSLSTTNLENQSNNAMVTIDNKQTYV